jgi:hypothetical protein
MSVFDHEPVSVEIQGAVLKCLVCGGDKFHQRGSYLKIKPLTFLGAAGDIPSNCSICDRCGYVHWFLPR